MTSTLNIMTNSSIQTSTLNQTVYLADIFLKQLYRNTRTTESEDNTFYFCRLPYNLLRGFWNRLKGLYLLCNLDSPHAVTDRSHCKCVHSGTVYHRSGTRRNDSMLCQCGIVWAL